MLKWLLVLTLTLSAAIAAQPAAALMESHPQEIEIASVKLLEEIGTIPGGKEFLGKTGKVYATHFGWRPDDFIIARLENDTCSQGYCPTAFISIRANGSKIIGIGYLPSRVLLYDWLFYDCRVCGRVYLMSFHDAKNKKIPIGVARDFLVVTGLSE